jgi:hypothetical protein
MHELMRSTAAMKAADASGFVDNRNSRHNAFRQRHDVFAKQAGKAANRVVATRWAEVNRRCPIDNCGGVWSATRISTLRTLCLRQQFIDLIHELAGIGRQ